MCFMVTQTLYFNYMGTNRCHVFGQPERPPLI